MRLLDLFSCAGGSVGGGTGHGSTARMWRPTARAPGKATVAEMQAAKGISWTGVHEELTEAIPPAYTEWIGVRLRSAVVQPVLPLT